MPRFPSNKSAVPVRPGFAEDPLLFADADGDPRGSNVPEVSVSELSNALKRTVEDRFGFVRLRGEISNYRGPHSSGHAYFCIKDEGARIDAVVWRMAFARLRVKPEEGMEVVATGKITTFPGKSSYQIVVESLEPAGIGALMAVVEERRLRLAAEGLFDAARKQALPFLPAVIGVVTSPTGAVIRDILHRVSARFPRHVLVWPVRVQGETSGAEVAAAIHGFNALADLEGLPRPHVLIVARGGGSLEDLWGFNDEAVVRAVAASLIPLISAVGHETDWTLIDHVADLRAPTPTGAAELAIPVRAELMAAIEGLRGRQASAALRTLDRAQADLRGLARLMPSGLDLLAAPRQKLDRAGLQLPGAIRAGHDRARLTLARLTHRLGAQSPQARMARAEQVLIGLGDRLEAARRNCQDVRRSQIETMRIRLSTAFAARHRLIRSQQTHERGRLEALGGRLARARLLTRAGCETRLRGAAQMLVSLGYTSVLARGFALVRAADGTTLRGAEAVRVAGFFSLQFADGSVGARTAADTSEAGDASRPRGPAATRTKQGKAPAPVSNSPQGSLFDR